MKHDEFFIIILILIITHSYLHAYQKSPQVSKPLQIFALPLFHYQEGKSTVTGIVVFTK